MRAIMMAAIFMIVLLGVLTLGLASSLDGKIPKSNKPSIVTIDGGDLLVNGESFIVKGVTYSPVPAGEDPRLTTYNDWLLEPDIYNRDFAMMKSAGINTIRLLDMQNTLETRLLFDAAQEFDIKIILGVSGPLRNDSADPHIRERTREEALDMVRAFKDHEAILMWQIGNEVNYWYPENKNVNDWYTLLEDVSVEVKKIDKNHPIITANSALKDLDKFKSVSRSVDIYGTNQYGLNNESWQWFSDNYRSAAIRKPFIITEFGADSWNSVREVEDETTQTKIVLESWNTLVAQPGFIGAVVFEWSDEWWKSGTPLKRNCEKDWQPFDKASLPDQWFSEECFGLVRQQVGTHEKIPKDAYFELQKIWPDKNANIKPTISFARLNGSNTFEAGVVTYGDVDAEVTLYYKTMFSGWNIVEMQEGENKYTAPIEKSAGMLSYRIVAVDAYERRSEREGNIFAV